MVDNNCIFCRIAAGDIPSETIYEDENFRCILDLSPASNGHTLILPKEHFADVTELDEKYAAKILPLAAKIGKAQKKSLGAAGFNLVQNNGEAAGQTVMHFHMHVIPRYANETEPYVIWEQHETTPEGRKDTGDKLRSAMD